MELWNNKIYIFSTFFAYFGFNFLKINTIFHIFLYFLINVLFEISCVNFQEINLFSNIHMLLSHLHFFHLF